jgi:hypothetical protein
MVYKELTIGDLQFGFARFTYDFAADGCCLTPVSHPLKGYEMAILAAASKEGLKLFRCRSKRRLAKVYRITDGNSFVDFLMQEYGVKVQKISVSPEDEDFLINKFAKVVFEYGAKWVAGVASNNDELARFARCGFATDIKSKTFALMAPQNASKGS